MTTLTIDPAEALAPFGDSALIPLTSIGDHLGMKRSIRNDLVAKSLIRPAAGGDRPDRAKGRKVMVDRDEALLIIASALLAAALGLGITVVIRGLRSSGAIITADAVSIPLPGLGAS
jgi:hypothetical protein